MPPKHNINEFFSLKVQEIKQKDPFLYEFIESRLEKSLENAVSKGLLENSNVKNNKIEMKILENRIKNTSSYQLELENKLKTVNMQLNSLKNSFHKKKPLQKVKSSINSPNFKDFLLNLLKYKEEIHEKKSKIQIKIALEQEKSSKMIEEEEKMTKSSKKKEIEQRFRKFKEKRENLRYELHEKEIKYKESLPMEKLYKKMNRNFSKITRQNLDERHKKMLQIKAFHKPISYIELDDFEAKFSKKLEEKAQIREEKALIERLELKARAQDMKEKFASKSLKKLEKLRKEELEKSFQKEKNFMNRELKLKEFAEEIKKKHMPKVDKSKALELELLKQGGKKERLSRYFKSEGDAENEGYKLGVEYLRSFNKKIKRKKGKNEGENLFEEKTGNLIKKKPENSIEKKLQNSIEKKPENSIEKKLENNISIEKKHRNSEKKKKKNSEENTLEKSEKKPESLENSENKNQKNHENLEKTPHKKSLQKKKTKEKLTINNEENSENKELHDENPLKTSKNHLNYLKEVSEKYNLYKKPTYWRKIAENHFISPLEKLEKLRQEAEKMEKKAQRKAQILHLKRGNLAFIDEFFTETEDIDDLLVNSIQAKLKLLEN